MNFNVLNVMSSNIALFCCPQERRALERKISELEEELKVGMEAVSVCICVTGFSPPRWLHCPHIRNVAHCRYNIHQRRDLFPVTPTAIAVVHGIPGFRSLTHCYTLRILPNSGIKCTQ